MLRRIKGIIPVLLCAACLTSGCSYKAFEDNMKAKISGKEDSAGDNQAILDTEETPEMKEENIFYTGDEVMGKDGVAYTVEKVHLVDNINEIGLDKREFSLLYDNSIDESGNIAGGEGFEVTQQSWYKSTSEQQKYKLVLVDILVKKIEITDEDAQMDADLDGVTNVWPSVRIGTGDGILYNRGVNSVEAVYMSEHLSGKNYNTFNLPKGQEKEIQIGWILPEDTLNMDWYYIINTASDKEDYKFCKLDIRE